MSISIGQTTAEKLAETYGTPLYVTDANIVKDNIHRFRESFQQHWAGPVHVLPAIKAATSIALLAQLKPEVEGCDLFSEGEYEAALRAGFSPDSMSLNGNGKLATPGFIARLVKDGVRITIDDIGELDAIEQAAKTAGVTAIVRLRMRPELRDFWAPTDFLTEPLPTHIASQAYKSGMPTHDLLEAGRWAIASPYLTLTGLHTHFGRHRATLAYWRAAGRATAREIIRCIDAWDGWTPREIDLGGGFAGPGDQVGKTDSVAFEFEALALQALRVLPARTRNRLAARAFGLSRKHTPEDKPSRSTPSINEYAEAVVGELVTGLGNRLDLTQTVLEIEPGRGLFTNAGSHIARVLAVKRQAEPIPWTWVVTDSSTGFLSDAETEHCRFPVRTDPAQRETGTEVVDVTGVSCNADRIVGDVRVPRGLAPGDLIVFDGTGAYNEQAATNFNSLPRPASVMLDDSGATLIRRRERIEDVFARDVFPSPLISASSTAVSDESDDQAGTA